MIKKRASTSLLEEQTFSRKIARIETYIHQDTSRAAKTSCAGRALDNPDQGYKKALALI